MRAVENLLDLTKGSVIILRIGSHGSIWTSEISRRWPVPNALCHQKEQTWPHYPLMRSWNSENPLPTRFIHGHVRPQIVGMDGPPWLATGSPDQPFDFCGHMERLCA